MVNPMSRATCGCALSHLQDEATRAPPGFSQRALRWVALYIVAAALPGCGGGGGGGYAIAGAVHGLAAGSRVTLSNNGSDSLTVTGSGSFVFSTVVAAAGSYSVKVITKPVGQTCSVANGTGANVMANVTTVSVTCSATETVLHSFGEGSDGSQPDQLIQAKDGNLYAVTAAGGANGNGSVFVISLTGVETVLYSFPVTNGIEGREPIGSLVQTSDGNFFGLTFTGGAAQAGTLFRLTPDGYESVVHAFGVHSTDGMFPNPSLTLGIDGNFYGTTVAGGGIHGLGVVFKITPEVLETIIYNFDDGPPSFGLIQASDGTFYGTDGGGQYGNGSVYSLTPAGLATFLYNFGTAVADGKEPFGNLLQGSDGNFYGVTKYGGANNTGTVYRTSPAGEVTFLSAFGPAGMGSSGATPQAGLIQANDGNFYGTTQYGGMNNTGTVFQLSASGTVSTLYSFGPASGADGREPITSLVQATDGSLYGTTSTGGAYQSGSAAPFGTVFKID